MTSNVQSVTAAVETQQGCLNTWAILMESKMFSFQVNLTLQMKIIEQEKEIEELKKQLSLLSQDRGLKR